MESIELQSQIQLGQRRLSFALDSVLSKGATPNILVGSQFPDSLGFVLKAFVNDRR
jgi:hypothetical protein